VTLYLYWILWVPSSKQLETDGLQWIVWGRAVSCLHNQAPISSTIDFLRWNTLTSSYSDITLVLILWVPEQHNWRTDGLKWIVWGRAVSCLHNQAPNWTNWLLVMEYTDIRYSDFPMCIDSVSAELENWGTDGLPNELCEESSSCLHNQAPNLTQLILAMEYTDISTVTYYMYWLCECPEQHNWGQMVSKWIVWGRAVSCLIIKHPISTHWLLVDGIHWHQVKWTSYVYWFCECQSGELGPMVPNELLRERVSCLHNQDPISTQLTPVMEYTHIRYSDITTCIDSVSARAAQLETDGLQMNCWGRAVSCLHNQTQLKHIWLLWWNRLTSVQWHTTCIGFCECQSSRTGDGWSPNELCEGEQSHAYISTPNLTTIDSCDGIHWHQ